MSEDVLVTRNKKDPLEPRLTSVKGTFMVSPGYRVTSEMFGWTLNDTMSATRLTEQVPMFPTRSTPTKMTFGWQQLDVNDAEIGVLAAPWLKAATERK